MLHRDDDRISEDISATGPDPVSANTCRPYDDIVVAVPVSIPYERFSAHPAQWWLARALRALVDRSGFPKADIDGLAISSFTMGFDPAIALTQHFGLSPRWFEAIPLGGASGVIALRRAARAVQSGDANIVACIAGGTNDPTVFRRVLGQFSRASQDAVYPYGSGGANASFALITDHYMRRYGARREDFGKLCVAQRANAMLYPHALMKAPLTLDEYLAARMIATPIGLFDCVMPCAGAEAFLVMRAETARAAGLPAARLLGAIERHNGFPDDPVQERLGIAMDAKTLWAMAGTTPAAIDFVQTYDDYPVISMLQFEALGLCAPGEGPEFVRHHDFTIGGSLPHNTSGGQLSVGQADAGGGTLGLVEAIRQLTGEALGGQVEGARLGLVSGFGMITYDRGLSTAAALLASDRW
jgi:acetyl-CoA acetyltransferase